ncbi:MAG: PilZ domain-containing protein [Planctomycetota bacterium]|nr:PilZ domain-containing protein [Planctomycetota bacterium]
MTNGEASSKDPSNRRRDRAASDGTVWISRKDRLVPAGRLLDLSDTGFRYRHDPAALDAEGFPLPVPAKGQTLLVAITLHKSDQPKAVHAEAIRIIPASDGSLEVGCRFAGADASEMKDIHRKYVDASLQRARTNLASSRAKLFHQPDPARRKREKIGEILVRRKAIDSKDLEQYLDGNRSGVPLGMRLLKAGLVTSRQLGEALSEHVGLPFVDLNATGVEDSALRRIKPGTAMQMGVVAYAISSRRLKIACGRPLTLDERKELESQARLRVIPHIADQEQIAAILKGPGGGKRTARHETPTEVLVRYRFYGPTMEQLDARTFEGAAANLSETGVLFGGPVPRAIVEAYAKRPAPRMLVAVQVFHGSDVAPVVLRFEPVRISPVPMPNRIVPPGPQDTPMCWIGARLSPLIAEDRRNLMRLCESMREE